MPPAAAGARCDRGDFRGARGGWRGGSGEFATKLELNPATAVGRRFDEVIGTTRQLAEQNKNRLEKLGVLAVNSIAQRPARCSGGR
jgi:hypothetical protein